MYQYSNRKHYYEQVEKLEPFFWNENGVCINPKGIIVWNPKIVQSYLVVQVAESNNVFYPGIDYWDNSVEQGFGSSPSFDKCWGTYKSEHSLVLGMIALLEKPNFQNGMSDDMKYALQKFKKEYTKPKQLTLF